MPNVSLRPLDYTFLDGLDLVQDLVYYQLLMEVNVHQAKTHLSKLLRRVAGGDEIIISRAGVPMARLVAVEPRATPRPVGMYRGQFTVPDDFDAPLPDEVLSLFTGKKPRRAKRAGKKSRRRPVA